MSLILNTWDLAKRSPSLSVGIQNTKEYLNIDIENDEGFFKDGVSMFTTKVLAMTEERRKQEGFPSQSHIKKLKSCWIQRINIIKVILSELNDLTRKNTKAYSKLIGLDIVETTIEVLDPKLIEHSMLLTRKLFREHVATLKRLSTETFGSMVEYTNDDIDSWFMEYKSRNEDIDTTFKNLSITLEKLKMNYLISKSSKR
jgi:phage pi2 protein 07